MLERLMSFDHRVSVHRTLGFLGILTVSLHPILILGTYAAEQIPLVVTSPPLCISSTQFITNRRSCSGKSSIRGS